MFKKPLLLILLTFSFSQAFSQTDLSRAGDGLQIALPIAAFATTLYFKDKEGEKEFIESFLISVALTHILKYSCQNTAWGTRPNGGSCSFPSGHTASAFQGAFFLQKRYGWDYGMVPIALAAFTGYTRVEGQYHHWRDVAGGAILSYLVTCLFVTKYCPLETHVCYSREGGFLGIQKLF
ncbi:MAG: phosphatase PAP2 family protein [Verrucomicrobia bacterium]|nr:phosphatase PAP2 family protein [Verrucomicrobiota bacterium]MBS0646764.1 phosphatase PAP2 family protein [Verrucomicrobiota bacterium]